MRAKKWLTFATIICTIASVVLMIVFQCNDIKIGYDISLALFGSAFLGFIMSLIEYFSERKSSMEKFWIEARKVIIQFRKAKPIVISEPEELIFNSFAEEIHNREVERYGEKIANSLGLKKESKAKNEYIAWMESHEIMNFTENDNISEILDELYKQHLEENKVCFSSIIDNYIDLSNISLSDLDSAYGSLDFMFGNKKIRRTAYEEIFNKVREIRNSIYSEVYHFNLWKEGKGNFVICAMKAMEISKILFESKISESGALKQECIYQRAFDEIEESLEDFRIKIYWSQKKESVKRIPIMGRVINFEDEE